VPKCEIHASTCLLCIFMYFCVLNVNYSVLFITFTYMSFLAGYNFVKKSKLTCYMFINERLISFSNIG
jgi:hypothetical protein